MSCFAMKKKRSIQYLYEIYYDTQTVRCCALYEKEITIKMLQ